MEFEWDPAKDELNQKTRGIPFERGAEALRGDCVEFPDNRYDYGEQRIRAIGISQSEFLHVVFTMRGRTRRIISVRAANRQERQAWLTSR